MTMVCRVCSHPDRKKIDRELISGQTQAEIARRYGLGKDSVWRHKNEHLGGSVVAGVRRSFENHGVQLLETMLQKMNELTARTESLLDQAEEKDQVRNALLAVQQLRNNYTTMGTIVTIMGQTELGMSSDELEEFRQWKANKDNVNLDIFSQEDRELIREICIEKLARMNTVVEQEDFRSKSFIVQQYGPKDVEAIEEVPDHTPEGDRPILTGTNEPEEQEYELRVDQEDSSLKPVRTTPRKQDPGTEMRRANFN